MMAVPKYFTDEQFEEILNKSGDDGKYSELLTAKSIYNEHTIQENFWK